ncbi:MAG: class I SAM-dependent methyltransferase [Alphaproteobacteria bacterium]|nr:class I SAM-dependent methyltransferase [Alphaproteobacteria bacterium]
MSSLYDRLRYTLAQGARVTFYAGHYLAARRLSGPKTPPGEPVFVPEHPLPTAAEIYRALIALFERDFANIEAGLYAPPHDMRPDLRALIAASRDFFRDLPQADARRLARAHQEVFDTVRGQSYPRYYLQNFHYQTDGWLSERSAALYDFQVETLFSGAADAMRRQALVPLRAALAGRDQRRARLLDLACGTGRFLRFVKENFPRLPTVGLDLSPAYLARAEAALAPFSRTDFVRANVETLPFEAEEFDVASAVFLFHELPGKARAAAAREIARVLRPGGRFLLVDSLQYGDEPAFDGLLDTFPVNFHEPYFTAYAREDLRALFGAAGLALVETRPAFLSKVAVFEKR